MKVYELMYMHGPMCLQNNNRSYGEAYLLGFFSSHSSVQDAISFYRTVEGFCSFPDGFLVFEHDVPETNTIYLAELYAHDVDYSFEYVVRLGMFIDSLSGQNAIKCFRQNNKADYTKNNLIIEITLDHYELNKRECIRGFNFD